ncbi:MAG: hypothetical protein HND48_20625 [Chloroflexi bacterium]|nr:hypothetical protein [Chloroflexota bacterium]
MRITRVVLFVVLLTLALPVVAQEGPAPLPGEPVVMDLGAPRGIAFDADGNLPVADAGTGGEVEVTMAGPEGEAPAHIGLSGRIVSVAPDGTVSDRIAGFPSYAMATETMGVYRAIPQGDSLWVIYSGSGAATTGAFWMDSVVEYDAATPPSRRSSTSTTSRPPTIPTVMVMTPTLPTSRGRPTARC